MVLVLLYDFFQTLLSNTFTGTGKALFLQDLDVNLNFKTCSRSEMMVYTCLKGRNCNGVRRGLSEKMVVVIGSVRWVVEGTKFVAVNFGFYFQYWCLDVQHFCNILKE